MFLDNLKKLQIEKGVTNYRISKELGIHQSAVANWHKGAKPRLDHAVKLAEFFGITLDDLVK